MQKHQYGPLCISYALPCFSMWTHSHNRLLIQSSSSNRCRRPLTANNCPGHRQGRRGHFLEREVGVLGWVVLRSLKHSEKLATTQNKHKQGHPLGRLTPRACVGACQPGLWPQGVGTAAEHPARHPMSMGSPQWKVCISLHGGHCG